MNLLLLLALLPTPALANDIVTACYKTLEVDYDFVARCWLERQVDLLEAKPALDELSRLQLRLMKIELARRDHLSELLYEQQGSSEVYVRYAF